MTSSIERIPLVGQVSFILCSHSVQLSPPHVVCSSSYLSFRSARFRCLFAWPLVLYPVRLHLMWQRRPFSVVLIRPTFHNIIWVVCGKLFAFLFLRQLNSCIISCVCVFVCVHAHIAVHVYIAFGEHCEIESSKYQTLIVKQHNNQKAFNHQHSLCHYVIRYAVEYYGIIEKIIICFEKYTP